MALLFDTAAAGEADRADEAADNAVQVVDLGDIVIDGVGSGEGSSPTHLARRRRGVTPRYVARLALAFVLGLALSVPIVAAVRHVRGDGDGSRVDIEDRRRELPDLPPPVSEPEPPPQAVDSPPPVPPDDPGTDTEADADPGGKAAFKQAAAGALPPAGEPTEATTPVPPTTAATAPSTTAATTTTTASVTPPDGPPTGSTSTTAPGPWDSDRIPGED